MTTQSDEERNLKIELLSYDKPKELFERYYFLEMSTLEATILLPHNRKILSSKIIAYNDVNLSLDDSKSQGFKTVGAFNEFFTKNPSYYIHNCVLEFENGTILKSHDDGEVSVQFSTGNGDQIIINTIFDEYKLDKSLIQKLISKPGYYFTINTQCIVTGEFESFDDYLNMREI